MRRINTSQNPCKAEVEIYLNLTEDAVISRKVDIFDLPSQNTEDIETFRQVLNIPDPRDSMPVSSTLVI